jgi:hypothetical protein
MLQRVAKILTVLVVGLTAVFAFAWSTASPASAVDICSTPSTTAATVTFVNASGFPIDIYWVDEDCNEVQSVNDLVDTDSVDVATFVGHTWLVKDSASGDQLLCFVVTSSTTVTVVGGSFLNGCSGFDGRLNQFQCDTNVAVYQSRDEDGNASLDVFGFETSTNDAGEEVVSGVLLFTIDQSDLADYIVPMTPMPAAEATADATDDASADATEEATADATEQPSNPGGIVNAPPEENTLIEESGNITAYVLNTGEIQVNTGVNESGSECVIIFDALQAGNMYHYTTDLPLDADIDATEEATADATSEATVPAATPAPTATP